MPMMHLCRTCGTDLAWLRPRREPRYDLRIITCPSCGVVNVREQHPGLVWCRHLLRIDIATRIIAIQLAVLAGLTAATVSGLVLIIDAVEFWPRAVPWQHYLGPRLLLLGTAMVATGAWFVAGLGHWQRYRPLLTWIPWIVAWLLVVATVESFQRQDRVGAVNLSFDLFALNLQRTTFEAGLFILALPLLIPGAFIGRGLRGLDRALRQSRWRRRRRRRRERENLLFNAPTTPRSVPS